MASLRVLLAGMVAGDPYQGGATWAVLQYLLGLRRLGCDVFLVEPVGPRAGGDRSLEASESAAYFRRHVLPIAGADRAALLRRRSRETVGAAYVELESFAAEAELLIDISGLLAAEPLAVEIPIRAYLDLDPGFNQAWHETGEDVGLESHTHFVTVGQAIGSPGCPVPTCGREWIPTAPPVVLERWDRAGEPSRDSFTTVGHWRSYGPVEHGGVRYGQRAHSLREVIELPARTEARLELALGIHPGDARDREALERNGWRLLDPRRVAGTPERYRAFIRSSKGEIGVAKSGYVASRCGWFSDRSACYLASGRPVVAQDTGFAEFLPSGEGLLRFSSVDEAAAAIADVEADWERHSRAAREIAREHLDSDRVLGRLLERLGAAR